MVRTSVQCVHSSVTNTCVIKNCSSFTYFLFSVSLYWPLVKVEDIVLECISENAVMWGIDPWGISLPKGCLCVILLGIMGQACPAPQTVLNLMPRYLGSSTHVLVLIYPALAPLPLLCSSEHCLPCCDLHLPQLSTQPFRGGRCTALPQGRRAESYGRCYLRAWPVGSAQVWTPALLSPALFLLSLSLGFLIWKVVGESNENKTRNCVKCLAPCPASGKRSIHKC